MTKKGHVVIAGGSGFLGLNLARHLHSEGLDVTILSRHRRESCPTWRYIQWDARSLGKWIEVLEDASALVNLSGRSVDCVKTPDHCDEILRSRVESTRVLGLALRRIGRSPPVWVQMSTAHRYGDPPDQVCDEESAFGYGLAPYVGKAWEDAFSEAVLPQTRKVILRTSFVLGRGGGALPRLAGLVRFGLGGRAGSGCQGVSWIHEQDMNRIFARAISDDQMDGAYIATAPQPVSNAQFMRLLRKSIRVPVGLPAPAWMIRLGAPFVLRTDPDLALFGRFCVSRRLKEEGFTFLFPDLESALDDIFRRSA